MQEIFLFKNPNTFYFLISYIIGSIPSGYLIFKYYRDTDIRNYGSGNIGATNVNRLLGKKLGAITLCFDFLKTLVPSYLAYNYLGNEFGLLCGTFTVIGHMFPLWLKFKGGKGVACFIGLLFIISWPLAIIFLLSWLVIVKIFKLSSLGAIFSIFLNLILFKLLLYLQFNNYFTFYIPGDPIEFNIILLLSTIILIKHKKNIKNILKKKL